MFCGGKVMLVGFWAKFAFSSGLLWAYHHEQMMGKDNNLEWPIQFFFFLVILKKKKKLKMQRLMFGKIVKYKCWKNY